MDELSCILDAHSIADIINYKLKSIFSTENYTCCTSKGESLTGLGTLGPRLVGPPSAVMILDSYKFQGYQH